MRDCAHIKACLGAVTALPARKSDYWLHPRFSEFDIIQLSTEKILVDYVQWSPVESCRFYVKSGAINPQLDADRQYRLDVMDIWVSNEYSHASDPRAFIATVPTQLVADVPPNILRALLPEYIAALILQRSPAIGKLRNLKIL